MNLSNGCVPAASGILTRQSCLDQHLPERLREFSTPSDERPQFRGIVNRTDLMGIFNCDEHAGLQREGRDVKQKGSRIILLAVSRRERATEVVGVGRLAGRPTSAHFNRFPRT